MGLLSLSKLRSHPTGVRGLKIIDHRESHPHLRSHPTGVRGLKNSDDVVADSAGRSHPTGVRGLKNYGWPARHIKPSRTPLGCVD